MSPPLPHSCPLCHMVDRVQKVSGLVTAGASTTVATGYEPAGGDATAHMRQEGSQRTDLSKLLSPPAEPPRESPRSVGTGKAAVGLSAIAICSLIGASAVANVTDQAGIGAYGVLLALAAAAGVVVLLLRTWRTDERLEAAWQTERSQWEAEMAKWKELYYCWRDDVVYFPGDSKSATSASAMRTLIRK